MRFLKKKSGEGGLRALVSPHNFRKGMGISLPSILVLFFLLFGGSAFAQEIEVTGTVTDPTGMPLPGANVIIKNTNIGVLTDFNGKYTIDAELGNILVFSYLGYKNQEIEIQDAVVNATMEEDVSMLSEVVVTGYTTQLRSEMATSVSKLDTKVLQSAPRSNPATALSGTIAGLKVTQTTGQPGSTPSITLRGGTAFDGGGSPLVLINGVPGSFYALNSADIASIEVLKDAASTAIYGARAANGVILITTKSGKAGSSKITYRHSYTINNKPETPNYLGAENYIRYNRKAVINAQRVLGDNAFQNFLVGHKPWGQGITQQIPHIPPCS